MTRHGSRRPPLKTYPKVDPPPKDPKEKPVFAGSDPVLAGSETVEVVPPKLNSLFLAAPNVNAGDVDAVDPLPNLKLVSAGLGWRELAPKPVGAGAAAGAAVLGDDDDVVVVDVVWSMLNLAFNSERCFS